jgi:hypothetical protein
MAKALAHQLAQFEKVTKRGRVGAVREGLDRGSGPGNKLVRICG